VTCRFSHRTPPDADEHHEAAEEGYPPRIRQMPTGMFKSPRTTIT
jgi:hypothetical protein